MKKIKLAYFGSPDFSGHFLEKLITDPSMYRYIEVKLVVTQPDQKVGRKQILTPTPVKVIAEKYNKEFCYPPSKNLDIMLKNIDLALVYAFGEIIPKKLLDLPKYGFWNVHPSLLPKYRGPSPIASPLINGDITTGVTIIKMDDEIDHGPVIAREEYKILPADKRPDLEKKLTDLGFEMFSKLINKLRITDYELETKEQNHKEATYTNKLTKQDGFIEFERIKTALQRPAVHSSLLIFNLFRGLYPWPGLWTLIQPDRLYGQRLKITDLELVNGKLVIKKVQLEGKNEVDFKTFNKAYRIF